MSPSPQPRRPLAVGDIIHGFAHGAFGRDHHHCVRIEAVGPDWIVARHPEATTEWFGPELVSGPASLKRVQEARDEPCSEGDRCALLEYRPLTGWSPAEMAMRQVALHVVQVQPIAPSVATGSD